MSRLRLVSTLCFPAGGFPRGTRGAAAFALAALREVERGADELAVLEPPGADRAAFLAALEQVAAAVRVPVLALARVAALDELRALLAAGADRIGPGPAIVATPSLLEACAVGIGPSRLLAELPVRRLPGDAPPSRMPAWARDREDLRVASGGFEVLGADGTGTGLSAFAWAAEAVRRGAGELLVGGEPWGAEVVVVGALARALRVPVAARAAGDLAALRPLAEAGADALHLPPETEVPRAARRALAVKSVSA